VPTLLGCLPAHWDTVTLDYLYRSTQYRIEFKQGAAKGAGAGAGASVTLDGVRQEDMSIALVDDGREHQVQIN
jgi:cellobiose phosphorylase